MKIFILMFALLSMLGIATGCSRDEDNVIQREESIGRDDVRDTDNYERTLPVKEEGEIDD